MSIRTFIYSGAALILSATASFAQAPANDNCVGAIAAPLGLTAYDSTMATDGTGLALDPLVCDMSTLGDDQIYADVWYSFSALTTGLYDIQSVSNGNPSFDGRIAIYNQSSCPDDPNNVIACDDDSGAGVEPAMIGVPLTAGSNYLIRVGSYGPVTLEFPAVLDIFTPPPPPANDECAAAIPITVGTTNFDQTNATTSAETLTGSTCGITTIFKDIWYIFTPPTTDVYDFESFDSGFGNTDTKFALYSTTTCPADVLNLLDCDDDGGATANHSKVSASLTMGVPVLLRAGTFSATSTTFPTDILISVGPPPPVPPANDDCGNATPITMFGTYSYDNALATTDGPDLAGFCDFGLGGDVNNKDVWFEYTPTVGGCTYISSLGLAGFDNRIAIYTTTTCPVDAATILACSDEEVQPIASPFEAGMDVTLSAGTTYLIQVGNFSTSTTVGGPGMFSIGAGPVAINNDGGMQDGAPGCAPGPAFNEFCFGDGGNQMGCTNCPCANEAPIGSGGGCLNSGGTGIRLTISGDTSVSLPSGDTTDLRFGAVGAPATAFCILNSGDALAPGNMANPCFGMGSGAQAAAFDGLRCAITNTRRHGGRSADGNGDVGVTNNPWGGEGGPPVGIAQAGGGFAAGQTRFFQIINRDDAMAVCMRALNTSQAVEVTFTP